MALRRISVMTFNLWQGPTAPANWPERRLPMYECLKTYTPDILCVQEHHPVFQQVILEALPTHAFIQDDFYGWRYEGNIFWNRTMFEKVDYGAIDVGMKESLRRLFWVLLKLKKQGDSSENETEKSQQLLVATAHFTWEGHTDERHTDENLRKKQAQRTAAALHDLKDQIKDPELAILFMGDLNENYHPRRILREAGFIDCFTALRLPPPPTHPQRPSAPYEDILCDVALDWIMHNNYARPLLANVLRNLLLAGGYSVSDHCPVMCIYEIGSGPYAQNVIQDLSGILIVEPVKAPIVE